MKDFYLYFNSLPSEQKVKIWVVLGILFFLVSIAGYIILSSIKFENQILYFIDGCLLGGSVGAFLKAYKIKKTSSKNLQD